LFSIKRYMQLSVVIVNYNTKKFFKDCLESIFKHTKGLDYELIVVDNASTDGSVEYLQRFKGSKVQRSKVIFNKENLGFSRGNNQGIRQAEGKYILLLNSDTLLKDNALFKMVEFVDQHPEISVLGPRLLNSDGIFQASVGRFPTLPVVAVMLFKEHFGGSRLVRWAPDRICPVDWVMGAALIARKEVFEKVGLLDEKIFMYMEEVEWCYRVKKAGYKIYFYPGAEIFHLGQGSSKTGRKEPILNIYKGLIYFYQKHKSTWELLVLRGLLKLKAGVSFLVGLITTNRYLKETYGKAFKIS